MKVHVIQADRHPLWGNRTIIAEIEGLGRVFAFRSGKKAVWACRQRKEIPKERHDAFDDALDMAWNDARRHQAPRL